ncbi:DUF3016 domain-containing protein [Glaciecola sp. MF2-115]|uniref:DUF3016 domain-containing protein n=1 Tax=Glaciecola sp. MF2-115 TaxID=3384827 RepID=UPI00399F0BE1
MILYFKALIAAPTFLFAGTVLSMNVLSPNSQDATSATTEVQSKVAIEWIEPKKFRDVEHPTISRKRYRESVFEELEAYFSELSEALPDGRKLSIKVTELDLAGTVQTQSMAGLNHYSQSSRANINEYRIMRDIDIPRMTFSYELKDESGQVIKEEEVNLKDMSYLSSVNSIHKNTALRYEKAMISEWFKKTFLSES